MSLSFSEMQMLTEVSYTVEDTRRDLGRIAEFFRQQLYHREAMEIAFEDERELPYEITDDCTIFFVKSDTVVNDLPENLRSESLGFVKHSHIVFSGRLVYPVKDVKGNIMGFCGWDKFEQPKYLDSKNHGYKAKATTLYGMEKLFEYYLSGKPVYVVEGIVCCLYLRSIGLQALAALGSGLAPYVIQILKRFSKRLIIIPDNDVVGKAEDEIDGSAAGEHFVRQAKKVLPEATIIQSIVAKDVDDTRKCSRHRYESAFIQDLRQAAVNPYWLFTTIRVR